MKVFTGAVVLLAAALGGCAGGAGNSAGIEIAGETVREERAAAPARVVASAGAASRPGETRASAARGNAAPTAMEATPAEPAARAEPAVELARAFTAQIAAGESAAAFDQHFEFDLALDRVFAEQGVASSRGEARAKLRDILVWTYPRPAGYRGFAVAGREDGVTLVRYTVSPGGGEAEYVETIAVREGEGGLAVTDIHVMEDFWFTKYMGDLHRISGHDAMTFLRGFHAAAGAMR